MWLRSGRKRPLPLDAFPLFTRSPLFSHRVVWRRSPDRFQPFWRFMPWSPGSGPDRETRCCGPLRSSNGGARAVARPFRGPLEGVPDRWSGHREPGGAVSPVSPRVGRAVSAARPVRACGAGCPPQRRGGAAVVNETSGRAAECPIVSPDAVFRPFWTGDVKLVGLRPE